MGIKRVVDTSFWTDGKVDEFTPEDKYFMLYLLTNPYTRQLGIYEISIKQVAFHLGYSVEAVKALIERFEKKYGIIAFSPETNEIAIINFLRHSVVKGGKPVEDCIKLDMTKVKNKSLIDYVFSKLKGNDDLNVTVKKVINDYFNEINNENGNDNDNDNERIVPRIVDESYPDSSNKHPRGEYNHVFLSDEEEEKLIDEYGIEFALRAIKFLDEYMEEKKDFKSDSHYLTIKRWVIDAAQEKEAKDIKNGKVKPARYGDFDVNVAFNSALERSYSDQAKTAADDKNIKQRMEALKAELGQGAEQ